MVKTNTRVRDMFCKVPLYGLAVLILVTVSGVAIADSKIGIASATKNQVQGIRGVEKRALANGSEIFLKEAVQTGDESVAQLVFLDNTNLSVGPGSLVQLDTFIYDPNRKVGEVIVEVGRGAFRFVTNSGKARNYTLRTPVATMGIRGTVFELVVSNDELKIKLNNGLIQVRTNVGQIVWLTRPETLLIVYANGTVYGPVRYDSPIIQFARLDGGTTASTNPAGAGGSTPEIDFSRDIERLTRGNSTPGASSSDGSAGPDLLPFSSRSRRKSSDALPLIPKASDVVPVSPSR